MRFAILVLLFVSTASAQTPKSPVPKESEQAKANKLIKELYQDEIDKAQDAAAKSRLALVLLQEAKDTTDDPVGRFCLFRVVAQLATEAGDAPVALQAIEEMGQLYAYSDVNLLADKVGVLFKASKSQQGTREGYQSVIDSAMLLLEETLAADDFPSSLNLLQAAEAAAIKLKNVSLVSSVRRKEEETRRLEREFEQWKPYRDMLAKDPTNPKASQAFGIYQALVKGNWDRGLPLLARSKGPFAAIAQIDLLEQTKPKKPLEVAEGWLKISNGQEGSPLHQTLLRAYHWYQQALAVAPPAQRSALEEAMQAIMLKLPEELRVGEIVAELKKCEGHQGPVYDAVFSPDGKKAISTGADGSLRLWDIRTGKELRRLDGHVGRVWSVVFSPDGRRVVSGGFDGSVRVWDLASGREIKRLPGHQDYVRGVAISNDGKTVVSVGDDRLGRVFHVDSGKEVGQLKGHNHFVWGVVLSRDGDRALTASLDKTARLWDVRSGKTVKELKGHKDTVLAVALSPDGRRALTGSTDKTLILWDLETGEPIKTFTGHDGYVLGVAFSPDGRRALSASADKTVRLWDVATGQEVRKLEGHGDQVWSVIFSRDGRNALSAGQDRTVRVWGGTK